MISPRLGAPSRARWASLAPAAIALFASAVVGAFAVRGVLAAAGREAVPLDDVFIHFQFARRLAEGAPFRYTGDAVSTGATSVLWPALLAPFWKAGVRGLSLVWVAWAMGTIAHAGTALETARLARRLTDGTGALVAGALCIAFGPFAWFAWSGMETMALAWVLMRTARVGADLLEGPLRSAHHPAGLDATRGELATLGLLAPLVRPEGALASVIAFAVLLGLARREGTSGARSRAASVSPPPAPPSGGEAAPRHPGKRSWLALLPIAGVLLVPVTYLLLTGHATSATARVKWLVHNPYFTAPRLASQIAEHARLLAVDVLNGGEWTWIFVPKGLAVVMGCGAVTLGRASRRAPWAAWLTLAIAVSALATCSYQTFLWNRVRYVWPFVPAGFVMCACLVHELGQLAARVRPPLQMASAALGAILVVRCAALLPGAIGDLSQSARAVDQQQVKLGEWVRAELPREALVGVNDTGAIAYLGERRTFDIVGLTTEGAGDAWVAGAGSRFERFETMPRAELPTHFIVYPEWFGADALLGSELTRATVTEHAILGGDTMTVNVADWSLLGSGARPLSAPGAAIVDEVDVADLDSERAHRFALGDAWEQEDVVRDGDDVVDGGRLARARDAFHLKTLAEGREASSLVLRVGAEEPLTLHVRVAGMDAGSVDLPACVWAELEVPLPSAIPRSGGALVEVSPERPPSSPSGANVSPSPQNAQTELRGDALPGDPPAAAPGAFSRPPRFASFHYWALAR